MPGAVPPELYRPLPPSAGYAQPQPGRIPGYAVVRPAIPPAWLERRTIPAYVIGSLAAFWVIERTFAAVGLAT